MQRSIKFFDLDLSKDAGALTLTDVKIITTSCRDGLTYKVITKGGLTKTWGSLMLWNSSWRFTVPPLLWFPLEAAAWQSVAHLHLWSCCSIEVLRRLIYSSLSILGNLSSQHFSLERFKLVLDSCCAWNVPASLLLFFLYRICNLDFNNVYENSLTIANKGWKSDLKNLYGGGRKPKPKWFVLKSGNITAFL